MTSVSTPAILVFVALSLGIAYGSRASLRDPSSHGFYRFFAFESLLALVVINVSVWFRDPLSIPQLMSWILLLTSAFLAVHGFTILRREGKPSASFETTTVLVTSGVYRYIRHPLYASLLYFGWGVFFKAPSLVSGVLALGGSGFLFLTSRAEENENLNRFGTAYTGYMETTKRFIPFVF
ncbi:MAG: hypothetical protein A2Z37_02435 [Chloroflexi bacterium RBG_19FT_COMBO_62_14]|nr:MAG: hypothetical protein A2Z37_02435 [Chloroflexi bacterium RBG_19FT_COMBO_62_14]